MVVVADKELVVVVVVEVMVQKACTSEASGLLWLMSLVLLKSDHHWLPRHPSLRKRLALLSASSVVQPGGTRRRSGSRPYPCSSRS